MDFANSMIMHTKKKKKSKRICKMMESISKFSMGAG